MIVYSHVTYSPLKSFEWDLLVTMWIRHAPDPSYSRKTSVCVWRPSVEVWSCRDFRVMSCPGLRSEPCCNKRFACSDATPSSSTWSSGGSLCTGGLGARTTSEGRQCTQRWVRGLRSWVNWLIERLLLLFSSLIQRLMLHFLLPGWLNTSFVGFMVCWFCFWGNVHIMSIHISNFLSMENEFL